MKSLVDLTLSVLAEAGTRCCASTTHDRLTILSRVEKEGISFCTISLPKFLSDFESALDSGVVGSGLFLGFSKKGGLPKFLSGFLRQVFSPCGVLLDSPSIEAIRCIRQICGLLKKVELECSPSRVKAAVLKYRTTDQNISPLSGDLREEFLSAVRVLWDSPISRIETRLFAGVFEPTHGSGASAERTGTNERWNFQFWDSNLERVFPSWDFATSSHNSPLPDVLSEPPPSRMAAVPKTLTTPRLIAIEPSWRMFIQQGLLRLTEEALRGSPLWPFMGWRDQRPNQSLARQASLGKGATLDLSEASDRVSLEHAALLFHDHQYLWSGILGCRSESVELLDGEILPLKKFASMGSALCFPVESMVFTTIVFIAIAKESGIPLPDIQNVYQGQVRVYGDDIIVPVEFAPAVKEELTKHGFVVNSSKSFWNGLFRESCGSDWYNGHNVNYIKARAPLPLHRRDAERISKLVALRNNLYEMGWFATARKIDTYLKRFIRLREVPVGHGSLGIWTYDQVIPDRVAPDTQVPEVRVPVLKVHPRVERLEGYGALMKFFHKRTEFPYALDHLIHSGRPVSVSIKNGWRRIN